MREAARCRQARSRTTGLDGPIAPAVLGVGPGGIVFERIHGQSLADLPWTDVTFPLMRKVGTAIGRLHIAHLDDVPSVPPLPAGIDAVQPGSLSWLGEPTLRLLRVIHGSSKALMAIRYVQSDSADPVFIHNDLRPCNVMVGAACGSPLFVDWEHAGAGPSARDIGSFLAGLIEQFVLQRHRGPGGNESCILALNPLLGALVEGYTEARQHAPVWRHVWTHMGVELLLRSLAHAQGQHSATSVGEELVRLGLTALGHEHAARFRPPTIADPGGDDSAGGAELDLVEELPGYLVKLASAYRVVSPMEAVTPLGNISAQSMGQLGKALSRHVYLGVHLGLTAEDATALPSVDWEMLERQVQLGRRLTSELAPAAAYPHRLARCEGDVGIVGQLRVRLDGAGRDAWAVQLPRVRAGAMPGYVLVVGRSGPPRTDNLLWWIYVNAPEALQQEMFVEIVRRLDRAAIPYVAKLAEPETGRRRPDPVVLYISDDTVEEVEPFLPTGSASLRAPVPGFARAVGEGVGVAQSRANGDPPLSAGQLRAQLVARGLIDACQGGALELPERARHVARRLAAGGVDSRSPHLLLGGRRWPGSSPCGVALVRTES